MTDANRGPPGVYGPRDLTDIMAAYRAILQEISEYGALADLANSGRTALDIRRLAAKHVMLASLAGVPSRDELIARALTRLAAIISPSPGRPDTVDAEALSA